MAAVRDARTMKWLRQRLTGSRCDTMLMQKIFDFVMHETNIDIEKLRKSLHHQVLPPLSLSLPRLFALDTYEMWFDLF